MSYTPSTFVNLKNRSAPVNSASIADTASVVCPGCVPPRTGIFLKYKVDSACLKSFETSAGALSSKAPIKRVAFNLATSIPRKSRNVSSLPIAFRAPIYSLAIVPPPTTSKNALFFESETICLETFLISSTSILSGKTTDPPIFKTILID